MISTVVDRNWKFYGVNFQNKKLIEIDGEYKWSVSLNDGDADDYYVFRNVESEGRIYDSNFETINDHIHIEDEACICRIGDEYYYSLWNEKDRGWRVMDFDGNIIFEHVKKTKNGVLQIGDDKLYDSVNKKME